MSEEPMTELEMLEQVSDYDLVLYSRPDHELVRIPRDIIQWAIHEIKRLRTERDQYKDILWKLRGDIVKNTNDLVNLVSIVVDGRAKTDDIADG